jgi:hypothetical protein
MTLSGELLIGLAAGIAIAVLALFIIRGRALLPKKAGPKSVAQDPRLEQLAMRVGMLEKQLQLTRSDLEEALKLNAESLRADIKLIQMQAQSARSAAETDVVDLAVRLARDGVEAEDIARRTGLPKDLIESIRVLHKLN